MDIGIFPPRIQQSKWTQKHFNWRKVLHSRNFGKSFWNSNTPYTYCNHWNIKFILILIETPHAMEIDCYLRTGMGDSGSPLRTKLGFLDFTNWIAYFHEKHAQFWYKKGKYFYVWEYTDTKWKLFLYQNGLLSACPYFTMWIMSFMFSAITDYIINKELVSIGHARKIVNSIGKLF